MPDRKHLMTILFVGMLVLQTAGCGTSSSNRVLQSVTVTPQTADGLSSPIGQVQFTATGTYSDGSTLNLIGSVAWNSSVPAVATVSNTAPNIGLSASVATGQTTITASSGPIR